MVTVLIELHAAAPYIRSEYEAEPSRVDAYTASVNNKQ